MNNRFIHAFVHVLVKKKKKKIRLEINPSNQTFKILLLTSRENVIYVSFRQYDNHVTRHEKKRILKRKKKRKKNKGL